jgi:hypothetical protein
MSKYKLIAAKKWVGQTLYVSITKSVFCQFVFTSKWIFGVAYAVQLHRCVPQEGGRDTSIARSISIKPNSGIFI